MDRLDEEKEKGRQSLFTKDQMQTFITQRALAASLYLSEEIY